MDWVRREAQRIEEKAQQRGKFADLEYYPWSQGLNHLRLLPPTKGNPPFLSKIVYQHFGILLDKPKSPITCYELSYPESQFRCPACIVLHELQNLQVDVSRFRPRGKAKTNCVDRRHPEWEVMIAELPMKVYNWVISQMATQMIDVTDPHQGVDIMVTMSGEGLDRDYVTSFPATGRSPLSQDSGQLQKWMDSLYELDKIYKSPDWNSEDGKKEALRIATEAERFKNARLGRVMVGAQQHLPMQQPQPQQFTPAQPQFQQPYAPPAPPVAPQPQAPAPPQYQAPAPAPSPQVVTASAVMQPVAQPQYQQPQPQYPPQPQYQPPPAPAQPVQPALNLVDSKPPCFGRAKADQSVEWQGFKGGYQEGLPRCMLCKFELECASSAPKS